MSSDLFSKFAIELKIKLRSFEFSSQPYFESFDAALNGTLKPRFHVVSAEPGSGKSRGIQKYLREFLDGSREAKDEGVIIFLTRLDEIKSYIKGASLRNDEYAVIVSGNVRKNLRDYGGRSDPTTAPVLFTTAQRFEARCGSSFDASTELFYKGKPRALRILDEEFTPCKADTISLDRIKELPALLRGSCNDLVLEIEKLEIAIRSAADADTITIPAAFIHHLNNAIETLGLEQKDNRLKTLVSLQGLAGKPVQVSVATDLSRSIIGEASRYPLDIVPMFIFDASARVNGAYNIMERDGLPVIQYPPSGLSYGPAKFHHLLQGAGKTTMRNKAKRKLVLLEAAAIINADSEDWQVVYSRNDGVDLPEELRKLCTSPERLNFVYWGNHRASNDLRHCKKVMVLGLMRYPESGYEGKRISYGGDPKFRVGDLASIELGEIKSNLLQSVARSNMRNHNGSDCGECNVYIIDSEKRVDRIVTDVFPGSSCTEITRSSIKLTSKQMIVIDHLKSLSASEYAKKLKKKDVYDALKIEKGNFGKLIKHGDFQKALLGMGLVAEGAWFKLP